MKGHESLNRTFKNNSINIFPNVRGILLSQEGAVKTETKGEEGSITKVSEAKGDVNCVKEMIDYLQKSPQDGGAI